MTDRALLAEECLQIEKSGGDVLDYLKSKGAVSPWGTWFRLQREELGRQMCQINDGKGRKRLMRLTLDDKKKAVQIAVDGGNPLNFLRELGSSNPCDCWKKIKKGLEQADPELYAKLPERLPRVKKNNNPLFAKAKKPEVPEQVPTVKVDGPLQIETKEPEQVEVVPVPTVQLVYDPSIAEEYKREQAEKQKITKPVNYDGFDVTAIRHHAYGELYRDEKYNRIDWRTPDGEEVSMKPEAWKAFIKDLPRALRVLGVDI